MNISVILFDLDDTLVVEEPAADETFRVVCSGASVERGIDGDCLHAAVRRNARALWHALPVYDDIRSIGISSWEGLWCRFAHGSRTVRRIREATGSYAADAWHAGLRETGVDDRRYAAELSRRFNDERRRRHRAFPDAIGLLERLGTRFRLGLITNGEPSLQREKIVGAGIGGFFEWILISGEVGAAKPDPRIFAAALERFAASPGECVMVGDTIRTDIRGARSCGIPAVWIDRAGVGPGEDASGMDASVVTIAALADLVDVPLIGRARAPGSPRGGTDCNSLDVSAGSR